MNENQLLWIAITLIAFAVGIGLGMVIGLITFGKAIKDPEVKKHKHK